jgi:hypothetical protein
MVRDEGGGQGGQHALQDDGRQPVEVAGALAEGAVDRAAHEPELYDKDFKNKTAYWANEVFVSGRDHYNAIMVDKEDAQEQAMDKQIKVQVAQKTYIQEEDTNAAPGKSSCDTNLTSIIVGGKVPGYGQAVDDDTGGQEGVGAVHDDLQ